MSIAALLLGLMSAAGLGGGDVLAGLVARRIGTVTTVIGALVVSLAILLAYMVVSGIALPDDGGWFALVSAVGVLRGLGYLALVQAFRHGPLTIVSTISGSSAAFKVAFAMLLLHEQLDALQSLAVPLATVGLVIATLRPARAGHAGRDRWWPGPLFAVVSVVALSLVPVGLKGPIEEGGWAQTILVRRIVELGATIAFLLAIRTASRAARWRRARISVDPARPARRTTLGDGVLRAQHLGLVAAVGVLDTIGLAALAAGLAIAPAWVIGLLSSASPIVAMVIGVVAFGERLRPAQWAGVAAVAVAAVLAAVG